MKRKLFLLQIFIVFFTGLLRAQSDPYHFEHLTITAGLPHNTVYHLLQDRLGFMWFGTQDGLVRYDGYACKVYRQTEGDTTGFRGKSIYCLLEDRQGNLWAGTLNAGINFRDSRTGAFRNLGRESAFRELRQRWVKALFEDRSGRIWIGTVGGGLWVYDPVAGTARRYHTGNSRLADNSVFRIAQDERGGIWIAAGGTGIYRFDEKTQDFEVIHSTLAGDTDFASYRKTLFADQQGHVWVGTEGSGLYCIAITGTTIGRYTLRDGLSSNNIMGIAANAAGQLLLATDGGGLNVFDPRDGRVKVYGYNQQPSALNTNALFDVLVDRDGNVWTGTYNGGVNVSKAYKTWFETYTRTGNKAGELSHRSVLGLCQTAEGRVYVGTDGGGLNLLDRGAGTFSVIPNRPAGYGNVVKALYEDRSRRLWLGYFNDGLSLFDPRNGSFRHFRTDARDSAGIGGNNVWSIAEDASGNLWLGIIGGGLNQLDTRTFRFRRYRHEAGNVRSLSADDVMCVFVDREGQVWAGTSSDGLNRYDGNGGFEVFRAADGGAGCLSANDIRCIYQDSKGRLWIGTESGGLNRWAGSGKFEHYDVGNGLNSNAVMSIVEDREGYLWLGTFRGISRFDPEKKAFLNFDFHHNPQFNANQFNQGAALRDDQGVLYFGGINGLTLVKPWEVRQYAAVPPVVLTDFRIFNQPVRSGRLPDGRTVLARNLEDASELHLSYSDNVFSFEFAALDYTEPYKNLYAYKMEGFDGDWRLAGADKREVTYTNLDPATYVFRVKGTNSNGVWGPERTIRVVIAPPFWKTWWFKLLVLLFLTALGWLALRIYTTRREMALRQQVLESERAILALTNENLAAEQAILHLQNEKLETEVRNKNTELMSNAAQTAHKNEILIGIKEQIELLRNAADADRARLLRGLKLMLETEIEGEKSWEQFTLYFDQVNRDFTPALLQKHPTLTQNDLRMCALTRLNMNNKEMAALLNISVDAVEKSRYRLKKRLGLQTGDDLGSYLRNL